MARSASALNGAGGEDWACCPFSGRQLALPHGRGGLCGGQQLRWLHSTDVAIVVFVDIVASRVISRRKRGEI